MKRSSSAHLQNFDLSDRRVSNETLEDEDLDERTITKFVGGSTTARNV